MSSMASVKYSNYTFEVDMPYKCPHCGQGMRVDNPGVSAVDYAGVNVKKMLTMVYRCVIPTCAKYFFGVYLAEVMPNSGGCYKTQPILLYPAPCVNTDFNVLNDIAPRAIRTYNQAIQAKAQGLDELAGIGLRRAIDYLLYEVGETLFPEEKAFNNNPDTGLKQRLKKYVESTPVKNLAEACVWLGNDFTHPVQRHSNTVEDLERLTNALMYHMGMLCVALGAKGALEPVSADPR